MRLTSITAHVEPTDSIRHVDDGLVEIHGNGGNVWIDASAEDFERLAAEFIKAASLMRGAVAETVYGSPLAELNAAIDRVSALSTNHSAKRDMRDTVTNFLLGYVSGLVPADKWTAGIASAEAETNRRVQVSA